MKVDRFLEKKMRSYLSNKIVFGSDILYSTSPSMGYVHFNLHMFAFVLNFTYVCIGNEFSATQMLKLVHT